MFTGIVQGTGRVYRISPGRKSVELTLRVRPSWAAGLKTGDSVAVNGCCLTVTSRKVGAAFTALQFDLLRETWQRTNLQFVQPAALVNLERPLRFGGTLDGHFVTGHIDDLGRVTRWERKGKDYFLEVSAPAALMRYIVLKGSVALDGISLTVANVKPDRFHVWIIPHTYKATALRERVVGDALNVETDILGKYVERFVERGSGVEGRGEAPGKLRTGDWSLGIFD